MKTKLLLVTGIMEMGIIRELRSSKLVNVSLDLLCSSIEWYRNTPELLDDDDASFRSHWTMKLLSPSV